MRGDYDLHPKIHKSVNLKSVWESMLGRMKNGDTLLKLNAVLGKGK